MTDVDIDGYTMWTSEGSLILVAPQVGDVDRQNVLGSLRYAQRSADGLMTSRFDKHRQWYRAYRNALGKRGWWVSHSCQSIELAHCRTVLAPMQPLVLWLSTQHPELGAVLERCVDALDPQQPGIEQLRGSVLRRLPQGGACLVLEMGVLRPGSRLSLCSIALETSQTPGPDWLVAALDGASLRGDLSIQSLMAEPAPELLEPGHDRFARVLLDAAATCTLH
ncbi:hypothetical protein [Pseudomonas huaxiensis]|uniref:hypothetical protein n=1 Tax=Pseudomonas huaxiensis TaxID=2213017 RepID=UPI000DA67C61|nr:hypothetical protein [Pseudomonas huaxiensis]